MEAKEYYEIIRRSSPVLRYCECFDEGSEKWNLETHSHPCIELVYYMEGKAGLEVGGLHVNASIFDTVVYPANCIHHDGLSGERKRAIICLWIDIPELVIDRPLLLHEQSGMLRSLFKMVYEEGRRKEPEPYTLEYLLKLLLTTVIRQAEHTEESNRFLREVIPYIHEHFCEKITLDELAELEHISVSYLSRKFRQYTDMTIVAYINRLRVEAAKQLLTSSDCSASEIAWKIGYESPKYFHRVFKSHTGESPSAFRKAYQAGRERPITDAPANEDGS